MKTLFSLALAAVLVSACGVQKNQADDAAALMSADVTLVAATQEDGGTYLTLANRLPVNDAEMKHLVENAQWEDAENLVDNQDSSFPFTFAKANSGMSAASMVEAGGGDSVYTPGDDNQCDGFVSNGTCYVAQTPTGDLASTVATSEAPVEISAPVLEYNGASTQSTDIQGTSSEQVVEDIYYQNRVNHEITPVVRHFRLPDQHNFTINNVQNRSYDLRGATPSIVFPQNRSAVIPFQHLTTVRNMNTCGSCTNVRVLPGSRSVTTTVVRRDIAPVFTAGPTSCRFSFLSIN